MFKKVLSFFSGVKAKVTGLFSVSLLALTVSMSVLSGIANAALTIDTTGIVADIASLMTPIAAIGAALLAIYAGVKGFKLLMGFMSGK